MLQALWVAGGLCGCASVPRGNYGVSSLEIEGASELSERAIARCLLTMERDRFYLELGVSHADCTAPPFDRHAPRLELWRWPWEDWPVLNPAVVEVDRERIERFYRARGFYDARVVEVRYDPVEAEDPAAAKVSGCDPEQESCTVAITFVVEEGLPIRVGALVIEGIEALPALAHERIAEAELPDLGERFDERDYDAGKAQLADRLAEASYPSAIVEGQVQLDHDRKLAHITYRVRPGPSFRFGAVHVRGHNELPTAPIVAAAGIVRGDPYRQSALGEVQREVYALGAFSSVDVERKLDETRREVDLIVTVAPLPYDAFRVGIGVTSGAVQRTETGATASVPQWDAHVFGRYERRHVFGTLGKLRIEERPRLIFQRPFPDPAGPTLGNVVRLRLTEPGLVEARTELSAETVWDYGPDSFLGFFRSDVVFRIAAARPFLARRLFVTTGIQHDQFLVASDTSTSDGSPVPSSYVYSFIDQELRVDLRDNDVQPRSGAHFSVVASQSVRAPFSDWSLVGIVPDARVYIPLPLDMVLAARLVLGMTFVFDATDDLDAASRALGPVSYRLRGGGAQGNRGYVAGELGNGREGGTRRWESALELRMRLGQALGFVLFYDMGDVNRRPRFRFDQTNPSAGFGLRYLTVVGAIRLDIGFRLDGADERATASPLVGRAGALHLTLGEAF